VTRPPGRWTFASPAEWQRWGWRWVCTVESARTLTRRDGMPFASLAFAPGNGFDFEGEHVPALRLIAPPPRGEMVLREAWGVWGDDVSPMTGGVLTAEVRASRDGRAYWHLRPVKAPVSARAAATGR
jgi:hypothetical protein